MATASNKSTNAAHEVVEEISEVAEKVAEKAKNVKDATVTAIKKNEEPEFYGEDGNESLLSKAKRLARDKRVVTGAVTALLLATGVVIVRKRNTVVEDDVNETPTEA
jgi:hypothetical protein